MARSYDLTSGSIPQHLLRLAAPLIMGNILQQLYNTVEAFILGRFAGDLEFAAVGVAGAAWATAASQAISAVLCILYLRRKAPELILPARTAVWMESY